MGRNEVFNNKNYAKLPKAIHATNQTDVFFVKDKWTVDFIELNNYGPKNDEWIRYILVVIDNFSVWIGSSLEKQKSLNSERLN